jgi:hypothetical protein
MTSDDSCHAGYPDFCEAITTSAVADTVAKLLAYPFGFHGDTGIRDYLYARLHVHGGDRLSVDDERPGYSTLLLQAEHYTTARFLGSGTRPRTARFDLALTLPPQEDAPLEERQSDSLEALFAFELGKNKAFQKVIDPAMVDHSVETLSGTSDVSKLYRELALHDLRQGWAIEFYDSRAGTGADIIARSLDICRQVDLPDGRRLVVVFVAFAPGGRHHVSSNDDEVQSALLAHLAESGVEATPELPSRTQVGSAAPVARTQRASSTAHRESTRAPSMTRAAPARQVVRSIRDDASATVEEVFQERAEFAARVIRIGGMREVGRMSGYVNLHGPRPKVVAQLNRCAGGVGLVLKCRGSRLPSTSLTEVPVSLLSGYVSANRRWLDGVGHPYESKGPAVAFFVPDEAEELDDEDPVWRDVARLLEYAKAL